MGRSNQGTANARVRSTMGGMTRWAALCPVLLVLACGDDDGVTATDTGVPDSGVDLGRRDMGTPTPPTPVPPPPPVDMGPRDMGPVDMGPTCTAPLTLCGATCVNTDTDEANCGDCDSACAAGETCSRGACLSGCDAPRMMCGADCVDPLTDNANCGACGNACTAPATCGGGMCRAPCAAPSMMCGATCIDVTSDDGNCGACGNACPMGQSCVASMCQLPCAAPGMVCGTGAGMMCLDTQTDDANCGACGNVCMGGRDCAAGACACPGGMMACPAGDTGVCIDTQADPLNCGACGTICAGGRTCAGGTCSCPAGSTACPAGPAGSCVDTQTDNANCGMCGMACAGGTSCVAGTCRVGAPSNDTRAGAIAIPLTSPTTLLVVDTTGASNHTLAPAACRASCGADADMRDVFYTFTLTNPELVYVDTFGSAYDTLVFLQDSAGNNVTAATADFGDPCNDDACTGTQSQIAARLSAGTYYVVVSGCAGGAGATIIRFQHAVQGSSSTVRRVDPTLTTAQSTFGDLTAGPSRVGGAGAEDTIWFSTCPGFAATQLNAATCGTATNFDSLLSLRTPGVAPTASDDNDDSCGFLSSITTNVPAGAGLHVLYVDSFAAGSSGFWSVNYRFGGTCATGMTSCSGVCSDLQSDNDNCGTCPTACSGGTPICNEGTCAARPGNDLCTDATPITLLPTGSVTTVTGTTAGAGHEASTIRCNGAGRDVYYSFTLAQRELVYIDTFGSSYDTITGFVTDCATTTQATSCNDDSCATLQSQTFQVFDPGTYRVVVTGFQASRGGAFTLNLQHMPVPSLMTDGNLAATFSVMGDNSGANLFGSVCGPTATTPTRWYHWLSCPTTATGPVMADTCTGTAIDTVLEVRHGNGSGGNRCNDDSGGCGPMGHASRIMGPAPAGAGIHVITVRNYEPSATLPDAMPGPFTLSGSHP